LRHRQCRRERNPADPRVTHTLTLEVDDFGNVLKSAVIGYGRRQEIIVVDEKRKPIKISNPELKKLKPEDQEKQTRTLITYTDNRFTNAIDDSLKNPDGSVKYPDAFRTPLICDARTYEITGAGLSDRTSRFQFEDWINGYFELFRITGQINYEDIADLREKQNRLIEYVRTFYRKNDLTGLLELGSLDSMALPGDIFKLAFTPGLLEIVFQRKKTDGSIEHLLPNPSLLRSAEGGYCDSQTLRQAKLFPQDGTDRLWTKSINTRSSTTSS